MAPHLRWDTVFIERFIREARTAARLLHPGIVHIYEVGQEGEHDYGVMEYLEGESLKALLQRSGRLPPAQALNILRHVAAALDYAHAQGVIHRDVKPANIIVTPEGRAVLTDFGIGRTIGDAHLTTTGTAMGTPDYMAPEQASGSEAGPAADLYALAVVAYELLTGRVPFQADSDVAVLYQVVHDAPPPLRQWRADLPAAVDAVLDRALAKAPSSRYPSGQAFLQELEQALGAAEQPTVMMPAAAPAVQAGAARPPARSPAWALGIGMGVLAVVVIAFLAVMLSRGAGQPAATVPGGATPPGSTARPQAAMTYPADTIAAAVLPTAWPTSPPTAPPAATARPAPSATPDPRVAIEAAIAEYARIRAEAEKTLNADLLRQICVDPYLSWKTARIQENIRDGTHWETWMMDSQITSVVFSTPERADVWARKTETKVFFARGSTIPDDEVCKGTIYSYRNCTYDAYYLVVRQNGRWYIADAQAPNANCQPRCQH